MRRSGQLSLRLCLLAIAAACTAMPAIAGKPDWAGGGQHGNKHQDRGNDDRGGYDNRGGYDDRRGGDDRHGGGRFVDADRRVVYDYFGAQARSGHCPPGLAKKGTGCLPPGQAKKWAMGRPLPGDVIRYPLPNDLLVRLPLPPAGHEYVRVASDILMIAVGTGMVVDAIQDITR